MKLLRALCIFCAILTSGPYLMARVGGFNRNRVRSIETELAHPSNQTTPISQQKESSLAKHVDAEKRMVAQADHSMSEAEEEAESPAPPRRRKRVRMTTIEDHLTRLDGQNRALMEQLQSLEEEVRYLRGENHTLRINLTRLKRKKRQLAEQLAAQLEDDRLVDQPMAYHYDAYPSYTRG